MGDRERVNACLDEIGRLQRALANANEQLDILTRSPFVRMVLAEAAAGEPTSLMGKRPQQ